MDQIWDGDAEDKDLYYADLEAKIRIISGWRVEQ